MQFPTQEFLDVLSHIKDGAITTTCLSFFGVGIRLMWKASGAINDAKNEWKEVKDAILASKDVVQTIATNHLPHIQEAVEVIGTSSERQTAAINSNTVTLAKVEAMVSSRNQYRN